MVRVKVCDGAWLLEPEAGNKTRATYSVYTDSGGLIPAFLANRMSNVGISRVFQAVRKQVSNPKYHGTTELITPVVALPTNPDRLPH